MKHLSGGEIVDLLEDALPAGRAAHGASCAACRTRVAAARAALAAAARVDVPDPSPLFWERLSARVAEAIDGEPARPLSWARLRPPALALAGALAVIALVVAAVLVRAPSAPVAPEPTSVVRTDDWGAAAGPDESWDLVVTMAGEVGWDEADEAGLVVQPGAIDRAVSMLSSDERATLARLIRAELPKSVS